MGSVCLSRQMWFVWGRELALYQQLALRNQYNGLSCTERLFSLGMECLKLCMGDLVSHCNVDVPNRIVEKSSI